MPSNSPSSVLAASPSSDTSNGMVSSWPSTNTRPTIPRRSRKPVTVPSSDEQSPP